MSTTVRRSSSAAGSSPATESEALERYAEALELVAKHANNGTMGCFIVTQPADDQVHVRLDERWFDGDHVRCEELAHRAFDADQEDALAASAEFVAELEAWGRHRGEQRDIENERLNIEALEAAITEEELTRRRRERKEHADELAQILWRIRSR